MGRRSKLEVDLRLAMFLKAAMDHPWADVRLIQSCTGLSEWETKATYSLALKRGLVERAEIPATRQPPRRFGPTPAGSAAVGQKVTRGFLSDTLLSALKLDRARSLLTGWISELVIVWSLSPFTLPARKLKPMTHKADGDDEVLWREAAYRSLRLDGLACLKFGEADYLNVALVVDPGDIKLDWFDQQFRSAYAWSRRAEFYGRVRTFPVWIVIAANAMRLVQLTQVWQMRAPAGESPQPFRVTTYSSLKRPAREQPWWNEHGRRTALWGGVVTFELPGVKPRDAQCGWWGQLAASDEAADAIPEPITLKHTVSGPIRWSGKSKQPGARLIRDHLAVSTQQRKSLTRVARHPLITVSELAVVLERAISHVSVGVRELKKRALIDHPAPDETGYVLTWAAVELLAAQAGFSPDEYAELVRWPVRYQDGRPRYSAETWLATREHTRLVLDFLVGLHRHGPKAHLRLRLWDHVNCLYEFQTRAPVSDLPSLPAFVIPDASGMVQAASESGRQFVDTNFWLEIDRHSVRGEALLKKLARYYEVGGPQDALIGRQVRVLLVVERDDESRLQAIRRRLLALNAQYRAKLDARLTRVDLLDDGQGGLDPTRKVWRTLESSTFMSAFNLMKG